MTATNHVLAGSLFAAATAEWLPVWVILPAAVLLHFVLDALPHFGQSDNQAAALGRLKWFLPLDAGIAMIVLLAIITTQPEYWLLMAVAGILCASPDLGSIPRFWRFLKRGQTDYSDNWLVQFHYRIQWCERPWGIYIELVFFAAASYLLVQILS